MAPPRQLQWAPTARRCGPLRYRADRRSLAPLGGVNLLQHDGCEPAARCRCARDFIGRLGNWLFFNNGYHTAHHLWWELHWSLLPRYHRRYVRPHQPADLEVQSLLTGHGEFRRPGE